MLIAGIAGISIRGIAIVRVSAAPPAPAAGFSGVKVIVLMLRSRTIVSVTEPSCFLLIAREMSPGESTFSPSTAVITSPAFNPAFAAALFSVTDVTRMPSATPK